MTPWKTTLLPVNWQSMCYTYKRNIERGVSRMKKMILMAGPCVIESQDVLERTAEFMAHLTDKMGIEYYFKASWDKANRTALGKYRGPGLEKGIEMLRRVKERYGVKIITDFHEPHQASKVAEVADIIQIPAYLSRQTDMFCAAAATGLPVQIKKAQFMGPNDILAAARKLKDYTKENVYLCERGTFFGYNQLVVDMAGLAKMKTYGYPVIFDATHSVQLPGTGENAGTLGANEYVRPLALAAVATGCDGLFMEIHPDPASALCDATCMLNFEQTEELLKKACEIYRLIRDN